MDIEKSDNQMDIEKNKHYMDINSRIIGAYGIDTMKKLVRMKVFVVGLKGVIFL